MIEYKRRLSQEVAHTLTYLPCLILRKSKKKALLNKQAHLWGQALDDNVLLCLVLYRVNLKSDKEFHLLARTIQWQVLAAETIQQVLGL